MSTRSKPVVGRKAMPSVQRKEHNAPYSSTLMTEIYDKQFSPCCGTLRGSRERGNDQG